MKIGIDARFLTHPQPGGFKTYTENLITALAEVDPENEYVLYLDRTPNSETAIPHAPNMKSRIVKGEWLPLLGMPVREQVGLARAAGHDRLDLLHCPALTAPLFPPCPLVLTLHDAIWHEPLPRREVPITAKRQLMSWYYRHVPEWAARNAALVITVSEAAKTDIATQLSIPSEKVVVTHEAAGPPFRPERDTCQLDSVRAKFTLPPDFVLAIGSADPRKNVVGLIDAYGQLPEELRRLHHLVIIWTHHALTNEIARRIESLGLMQYCHFLSGVSNGELVLLYNAARLFAFPSRREGFGLPLLEAMACGTPVVAANNSSIPEVVGDAAMMFDADNPEQMAHSMGCLLGDANKCQELAQRGLRQASKFSWVRCAEETVGAYRQCSSVTGRRLNPNPVSRHEEIRCSDSTGLPSIAREK
jgi:glycosyltransferase involved in cell wall biosynthesis